MEVCSITSLLRVIVTQVEGSRVRALEPPEGLPAKNLPAFVPLLDRSAATMGTAALAAIMLVVVGVVLLILGRHGVAVPLFLVVFMTPVSLYFGFLVLAGLLPLRKLAEQPFRQVNDRSGVLVAGSRVSIPLDGRWLVVRLPASLRAQLSAQRRLWVLGKFVLLPGLVVARNGVFRPAPATGSAPLDAEPVSAERLLSLHRRTMAHQYLVAAGLGLVAALFGVWAMADFPEPDSVIVLGAMVIAVLGALSVPGLVIAALMLLRPLPPKEWTELPVISGPADVNMLGMVTVRGKVMLPDGREVTLRAGGSDHALAANIAATGRLWVLGVPVAGKAALAGVPGHAVFGPVRFGR